MIAVDTAVLPEGDRADAMTDAMRAATQSTTLIHNGPRSAAYLRQRTWRLGPVDVLMTECSPLRLRRTREQADQNDERLLAIGMYRAGTGWQEQDGLATPIGPGHLYVTELGRPYDHFRQGAISARTVRIPTHRLGLSETVVARASAGLATTPVQGVFQRHLTSLVRSAGTLERDGAATVLGEATIQLARALLVSAAGDDDRIAEAMAETLVLRITDFVRIHLRDPQLQPAMIAAAHHISLRHLYQVCAQAGIRLEQQIIQERLEAAREELASPASRRRTIAAVAHEWGFANASHFSHRFREAYGMTPREWQAICTASS